MTGHQIRFFAERTGAGVNWRLLAPNNREAGRGARAFPDVDRCRAALLELRASADRLTQHTRRAVPNGWVWDLRLDGEIVATSARPSDRLIRCQQVLAVVSARLLDAPFSHVPPPSDVRRRAAVAGPTPGVAVTGCSDSVHPGSVRRPPDTAVALPSSRAGRPAPQNRSMDHQREIA